MSLGTAPLFLQIEVIYQNFHPIASHASCYTVPLTLSAGCTKLEVGEDFICRSMPRATVPLTLTDGGALPELIVM